MTEPTLNLPIPSLPPGTESITSDLLRGWTPEASTEPGITSRWTKLPNEHIRLAVEVRTSGEVFGYVMGASRHVSGELKLEGFEGLRIALVQLDAMAEIFEKTQVPLSLRASIQRARSSAPPPDVTTNKG